MSSFWELPRITRKELALLLLLLGFQLSVWWQAHTIRPQLDIVPDVPSPAAVSALSLGDPQFYFRILGLQIQNAGDSFGRVTALKDYDFEALGHWFSLLDILDSRSHYIPALASYYYAQTQHTEDVRYIVDYLEHHADLHPERSWWWYTQAAYLANHKLGDKRRALEIAEKLRQVPGNLPVWTRQLAAIFHAELGEKEEALAIIESILADSKNLTPGEINYMRYFIEERLKELDIPAPPSPSEGAKP